MCIWLQAYARDNGTTFDRHMYIRDRQLTGDAYKAVVSVYLPHIQQS